MTVADWIVVALAIAASAVAVYAFFVEPSWLRVRERELRVPGLPPVLDGVRVAHLSDLHLSVPDRRVVAQAVQATLDSRPDLVAVTGDITQHGTEHDLAASELQRLAALPAFAVLGNHDYHAGRGTAGELAEAVSRAGLTMLRDESVVVRLRGQPVRLIGIDLTKRDAARPLRGVVDALPDPDVPRILLAHSPSSLRDLRPGDALFALIGHTHGGQVFVPGLTWAYIRWAYGGVGDGIVYRKRVPIHVSRGLATSNISARFLRRPELTILTLRAIVELGHG